MISSFRPLGLLAILALGACTPPLGQGGYGTLQIGTSWDRPQNTLQPGWHLRGQQTGYNGQQSDQQPGWHLRGEQPRGHLRNQAPVWQPVPSQWGQQQGWGGGQQWAPVSRPW